MIHPDGVHFGALFTIAIPAVPELARLAPSDLLPILNHNLANHFMDQPTGAQRTAHDPPPHGGEIPARIDLVF